MFNNKNTKTIRTLYKGDIDKMLERLEIKEKFDKKEIKCKFCKRIINKDNMYSIFTESNDVKFVCDEYDCINKMFLYLEDKKRKKIKD